LINYQTEIYIVILFYTLQRNVWYWKLRWHTDFSEIYVYCKNNCSINVVNLLIVVINHYNNLAFYIILKEYLKYNENNKITKFNKKKVKPRLNLSFEF